MIQSNWTRPTEAAWISSPTNLAALQAERFASHSSDNDFKVELEFKAEAWH